MIVIGLYSVLWGKSKDEPSSFSDMDKELPLSTTPQLVTFSSKANAEMNTKDASVVISRPNTNQSV